MQLSFALALVGLANLATSHPTNSTQEPSTTLVARSKNIGKVWWEDQWSCHGDGCPSNGDLIADTGGCVNVSNPNPRYKAQCIWQTY
jgi:hypothetical protein